MLLSRKKLIGLTRQYYMLHEEEHSHMQQRDAVYAPQVIRLFVRMSTPRSSGT